MKDPAVVPLDRRVERAVEAVLGADSVAAREYERHKALLVLMRALDPEDPPHVETALTVAFCALPEGWRVAYALVPAAHWDAARSVLALANPDTFGEVYAYFQAHGLDKPRVYASGVEAARVTERTLLR